jgi:cytochrome b561
VLAGPPPDPRADRLVQAIIGVLILTGFVFKIPALVPAVGLLAALVAVAGPRADPIRIAWRVLVAPRLGPVPPGDISEIRHQHAALAAACGVASIVMLAIPLIGWLVAMAAAVVAILGAASGVALGAAGLHRLGHRSASH